MREYVPLTLHVHEDYPAWWAEFLERCGGKLRWIKGVNVYPDVPGVQTVGRPYVDDALSEQLVFRWARA